MRVEDTAGYRDKSFTAEIELAEEVLEGKKRDNVRFGLGDIAPFRRILIPH